MSECVRTWVVPKCGSVEVSKCLLTTTVEDTSIRRHLHTFISTRILRYPDTRSLVPNLCHHPMLTGTVDLHRATLRFDTEVHAFLFGRPPSASNDPVVDQPPYAIRPPPPSYDQGPALFNLDMCFLLNALHGWLNECRPSPGKVRTASHLPKTGCRAAAQPDESSPGSGDVRL